MTLQPQFAILPIVSVVLLSFWLLFWRHRDDRDNGFGMWSGWRIFTGFWVGVVGAVVALVTLILMIPFSPTYWTYNHVSGTVDSVSNRFVGGTGELTGDYVLHIDGLPGVYNVQDDRIQGVKIGDLVDLTCTVQWVYAGQDQNNCFIRSWGGDAK